MTEPQPLAAPEENARLAALYQVSRALGSSLDLDETLLVVMRAAIRLTGAERGFLMLFDEAGELVFKVALNAHGASLEAEQFEISHGVVREIAQTGTPVVTTNAAKDPRFASQESVVTFALRSILAVPLMGRGRMSGVLYVDNKIRDALFELSDLELLNAFAGQAAMAIENARLHTQTDKALTARVAEQAALAEENARLKAALTQARDSKSEFVRTVSHELKIPMTSIKGYTDLLKMVGQLNPQQEQFVGVIRANVDRMAVLVSDLADIARVDSGRLKVEIETVDLRDSVREVLASLRGPLESKQQSVTQDFPPDLPRLRTDSMRLVQVLANLINNAHKYSPAGHGISVAATVEDGFVHVRVCDQGYGIAPADQARLFEQFFRSDEPAIREQPGWGLGLHLSKRLVELLGGEIRAESTPGEGSTFVFTVPAEN